jgi:hypothetical protein
LAFNACNNEVEIIKAAIGCEPYGSPLWSVGVYIVKMFEISRIFWLTHQRDGMTPLRLTGFYGQEGSARHNQRYDDSKT